MSISLQQFDVVVVPFPFTDKAASKRRPALVISDAVGFNAPIAHSVMAMITTASHAPWPFDVPIQDLAATRLAAPSLVRMKLFTLDHDLVVRKLGHLATPDCAAVSNALQQVFVLM
jgi:mRNA interferase MazF